jgi:drug/metabolite transporter (DMT)-like permease
MFVSTAAFALANVFVKLVSHIPPMEIVFFRCFLATIFCLAGLYRAKADPIGENRLQLLLRGVFGTAALFTFFITLQNMPLASAMTIQYLSPIFTTIIAIFLLRESVAGAQWAFYTAAFAGVLLIEQFDTRISPLYLALGIFSAFGSGVAYNLVRSLRGREHPLTVVLHFQVVGMLLGLVSLFFDWKMPVGMDWLYLLFIGIFSQVGQIFLTNALQSERAAGVAIINYSGLIYALVLGWAVFGETYDLSTSAGMALVVGGVLMSILYGRRQASREALEVTAA